VGAQDQQPPFAVLPANDHDACGAMLDGAMHTGEFTPDPAPGVTAPECRRIFDYMCRIDLLVLLHSAPPMHWVDQ
jgi:hypothetical protein